MSLQDCLGEIRKAFDGALSDEAILEVLEEFDAVSRATAEQRPWANVQQELFGHAEKLAKQAREKILIERRNRSMNNRKEAALRAFLDDPAWAKDPNAGATAKVFGSLGFEAQGGKASVHRQGVALGRFWIGSLDNALTKADLMPALQRGVLDRQIAAEMWELGKRNGKPGRTGSKEALEAARIIHRLQETMVARLNRAGAFIKRMPGYIVRQTHDMRLIGRAGFDAWYKDVWPKVDEMRTFNRILADDEREAIYRRLFNEFAAGRHPSALQDQAWQAFLPSGGNLAKRVSQHRELHFRSGEEWHAYHQKYGRGTILEAVASAAQGNARAVALMETFGTNPEATLRRFVEEADNRAAAIGAKTSEARNRFSPDTLWAIVSGEGNRPADTALARLGNAVRATQVASKLGSAVLSAYLSDPKLQANELARHGVPFLRRALIPWQNVIRMASESGEQRKLANMLQAYRDGMLSEVWGRYDTGDGLPGVASWFAAKTMKWSGMNRWTTASKANIVATISHEMADRAGTAFDQLEPEYRKLLRSYGITADDWGRLGSAQITVEGVPYVVPHQLKIGDFLPQRPAQARPRMPPDQALADIASKRGREANRRRLGELDPLELTPDLELRAAIEANPRAFDGVMAHGIAGADAERQLAKLLSEGIDPNRRWNTGDLGSATDATARAAGVGAKVEAPYVLISKPGRDMQADGIDAVIVNDTAKTAIGDLRRAFPGVEFLTPAEVGAWKAKPALGEPTAADRRAARRARDELSTKLITFIDDRMAAALNEPGARTRAHLIGDSRPGTWRGEFWRAATLFKSFPVEMLNRVYGEKVSSGEYASLAGLFLTMTVLGAATNLVRDAARGIAPPDYAELSPKQGLQLFLRAAVTGGGLGLFGDFVLGEYNRFGGSMTASLAGPVLGQADKAAEIFAGVMRAPAADDPFDAATDVGAKAFKFLYSNLPFVNLWFARQTLDYFVLYNMQEWLNPGYLQRMERRREAETGQRFILAPSEVVGR